MNRLARLSVTAVCATGLATSGLLATVGAAASGASTIVVPVDRQDYTTPVTTTNPYDGSTVDPYDGDPSSIHVAMQGGQPAATSYVHVALDYIPQGTVATGAVMTLHLTQQSDASNKGVYPIYNVNNSQAIIEACALKSEVQPNFDDQHPPAYDCQHGSAAGKQSKDGQIWTFDLAGLLGYWHEHGNTGAALIGIGSGDDSDPWQVAFYKSRSAARVVFSAGPTAPKPTASAPVPATHTGGSGAGA